MAVWICLVLPCLISSFSIYYAPELASEFKVMTIWIYRELLLFNYEHLDILCVWIGHPSKKLWPFEFLNIFCCSILSVSIYYLPLSDIRVKSYGPLNLPSASMLNFEHLDILFALIGDPSKKLWPFEFLKRFRCSISSVSIFYLPVSNIRVKSCGRLNLSCTLIFNFNHVDILCAWIRHLSEKFWPYEFAKSFHCSISTVSIYYWPGSDIQVKSCGRLNLPLASMFNFEHLDILCPWSGDASEKLWPFEFALCFHF